MADLQSAYVDGALSAGDTDRVLSHLAGCEVCRADIDDLRHVRLLLNRAGAFGRATPDHLSHRLVSIAGDEAHAPLWSRPFRRTRPGTLPSRRHRVRNRAAVALVTAGVVVGTIGGVGYAAGPAAEAAVSDPSSAAKAEFTLMLSQWPLTADTVGAVMAVDTEELEVPAEAPVPSPDVPSGTTSGPELSGTAARVRVEAAIAAADQVDFAGVQTFHAVVGDRRLAASAHILSQVSEGLEVQVSNAAGQSLISGSVSVNAGSRLGSGQVVALLLHNYQLTGRGGAVVAGRAATAIEASSDSDGSPAARWWIDDATNLLLWQETYDPLGRPTLSTGFTELAVGDAVPDRVRVSPRLAVRTTTSVLTVSTAGELSQEGWSCHQHLAGLDLVQLRTDAANRTGPSGVVHGPGVLHMAYSDGLATVSVFEERGRLDEIPAGFAWDADLGAYLQTGTPTMAIWQSGPAVFTAATDGSESLLRSAVAELPHEPVITLTTMERVEAGWASIFARTKG